MKNSTGYGHFVVVSLVDADAALLETVCYYLTVLFYTISYCTSAN